jgi:hypothetical protein
MRAGITKEIPMTEKKKIEKRSSLPVRVLTTEALCAVRGGLNFTKITYSY